MQQFGSADLCSGCSSLAKNCSVGSYLSPGVSRVGYSCLGLRSGIYPFWIASYLSIFFPVQCDFEFPFYLSSPSRLVVVMDLTTQCSSQHKYFSVSFYLLFTSQIQYFLWCPQSSSTVDCQNSLDISYIIHAGKCNHMRIST